MKGCLIAIGGAVLLMFVLVICAAIFGGGSKTGSEVAQPSASDSSDSSALGHSDHKAVPSAKLAEQIAGGFNSGQRALYRQGLEHIANEHGNLGSFTIAQVIDGQRSRNEAEAAAVERAKERAIAVEAANYYHGEPGCLLLDKRTLHTTSDDYLSYVAGTIKNTCDKDMSYVQVQVNFYDNSGAQEDSGLANVTNLAAGDSWNFKVIEQGSDSGTWRVAKFSGL